MYTLSPVHEKYDSFFSIMSTLLNQREETECSKRIESIRNELLTKLSGSSDEDIKKEYKKRIPEIAFLIQNHKRDTGCSLPYNWLPTAPEGYENLKILVTSSKIKKIAMISPVGIIQGLIKEKKFDLALEFIENMKTSPYKDDLYELFILEKYKLTSSTPGIPDDLKELLQLIKDDKLHDNTLYQLFIFDPDFNNPGIIREVAGLLRIRKEDKIKQLLVIADRQESGILATCQLF